MCVFLCVACVMQRIPAALSLLALLTDLATHSPYVPQMLLPCFCCLFTP